MKHLPIPLLLFSFLHAHLPPVLASVTVYYVTGQAALGGTATKSSSAASYTGAAAYDPTILNAPDVPSGDAYPSMQFGIELKDEGSVSGLSIPQQGSFYGFSIEMSVANAVLGRNSSYLQVPFLNLMANMVSRAGQVNVRVGGNTQEFAVLVDSLADGKILEKNYGAATNPTNTPPLEFTEDLIVMMKKISDLTNVRWYLGIPFNDTNWRLAIAEKGEEILGDYLLGFQAGNEPDLYADHGKRQQGYTPYDYLGEMQSLVYAMDADSSLQHPNKLLGPNVNTGDWTPEMVWDTGFVDALSDNLAYLTVEHYPTDNCFAQYGTGTPRDGQTEFPNYLNHTSGQALVQPYLNSSAYALSKNKPLLMFETNTASCGGFAGLSDSFGAALWALDYGMQMAYSNFSGAMLHVGGQGVFYNPFTPPPTNQSTFHQWTIGPVYYSALILAETFGTSNQSRILDLGPNNGNIYTPGYAIYEGGVPVKVALFNYITDPSGGSEYTASLSMNNLPGSVKVKYLTAPSVSTKGNYTWGGQTFGDHFASDGRPSGTEDIQTVTCSSSCDIKVPAPGFALVFLSPSSTSSGETGNGVTAETFATTAYTKTINTVTVDASVLATSNGDRGKYLGSTSKGSASGASRTSVGLGVCASLVVGVVGSLVVLWGRW